MRACLQMIQQNENDANAISGITFFPHLSRLRLFCNLPWFPIAPVICSTQSNGTTCQNGNVLNVKCHIVLFQFPRNFRTNWYELSFFCHFYPSRFSSLSACHFASLSLLFSSLHLNLFYFRLCFLLFYSSLTTFLPHFLSSPLSVLLSHWVLHYLFMALSYSVCSSSSPSFPSSVSPTQKFFYSLGLCYFSANILSIFLFSARVDIQFLLCAKSLCIIVFGGSHINRTTNWLNMDWLKSQLWKWKLFFASNRASNKWSIYWIPSNPPLWLSFLNIDSHSRKLCVFGSRIQRYNVYVNGEKRLHYVRKHCQNDSCCSWKNVCLLSL